MRPTLIKRLGVLLVTALVGLAAWPSSATATSPNDPYYPRQWALARVGAPTAWKTTMGQGVTVAVVDSGVNRSHEDLKANLSPLQYDSVAHDNYAGDAIGHGTLVAGVIAAVQNNKLGVSGVAPKAKIMAIRVADVKSDGSGIKDQPEGDGIRWAADHGAKVINVSIGGVLPGPIETASVYYALAKGALVVASASNDGLPFCEFPAAFPGVLCVGATDSLDRVTSFSNYGVRLDVVAPGKEVWSTGAIPRAFGAFPTSPDLKYQAVDGTSFSSPMVAGIGALLMSMGASNVLAGIIIRATARDLGLPGYDITYGFGRVDAAAAVALCKQIC